MMDEAEIKEVVASVLAEMGLDAPTAKDKGKIMKNLMPKVKGKADGKLVNEIVSCLLYTSNLPAISPHVRLRPRVLLYGLSSGLPVQSGCPVIHMLSCLTYQRLLPLMLLLFTRICDHGIHIISF